MAEEKKLLHPRNKHKSRYDFAALVKSLPELRVYVRINPYGDESIDFADSAAVKTLNKALLKKDYEINFWDIPDGYLCPPIPGRADYIHYLADVLASTNGGEIPRGKQVKVLDIGTGANCVYPIIGHQTYGWSFVGTDVDKKAIQSARNIISSNPTLAADVQIRQQPNPEHIFKGIIKPSERFDITLCNPPFHASAEEAAAGSQRKLNNLGKSKQVLNFGGQHIELWYPGGEVSFVRTMISESEELADQCKWFTSLVSKSANLPFIYTLLERAGVAQVKTVEMAQGQKISRFVAWTFQKL
ncbi:MAG: 23S rRNA (adenine(1618)-N(6))-methyltransferase RlmF [Pedobacter sp.]|nr:MAG: 23S rRNA (adenine(1618)-N(6))-methyltransferase RlmF [Pedobacter sp.]